MNAALHQIMESDDSVIVLGNDVAGLGGIFNVTGGLYRKFGRNRCLDMPVSESGTVGMAVGLAMSGLRPIVECQFDAFAYPALEQIYSHVAKMKYRTGGNVTLPLVIRIPYGGGVGAVEHHSDSSEILYTVMPGLSVYTPGSAQDAYELLHHAVRSDDPVVFFEPKRLYNKETSKPLEFISSSIRLAEHPDVAVRRRGSDLAIICYGSMAGTCCEAAEMLSDVGINVSIVDLRCLSPIKPSKLLAVVKECGLVLVVHESAEFCGYGAEVSALIGEECFDDLKAPVRRLAGVNTPYPPPNSEKQILVGVDDVVNAAIELMDEGGTRRCRANSHSECRI